MKDREAIYVHYVDNCSPKLKKFKNIKSAERFISKFTKENARKEDGYWIDFVVEGTIIQADDYYQGSL